MGALSGLLVLALAIPFVLFFRASETSNLRLGMERDALVLATNLSATPTSTWPPKLEQYQRETGARLTVVDSRQRVVYDTEGAPAGTRFPRPEMATAIDGGMAAGTRESATLGQQLTYVAVPINHGAETLGALRLSMPASLVESKVRRLEAAVVAALVLVLVLALLAAWAVARILGRPLRRLVVGARRVGADPSSRVGQIGGTREVQDIADALDDTAARLEGSIQRSQAVAEEASHHLRTPLAAMRLRLEAVADESTDEQAENAEAALAEVDRLSHRVDQILAIATTDAGATPDVVDLSEVVDRVAAGWRSVASEGEVEMQTSLTGVRVVELPGSAERTADELLGNALAYASSRISVRVFVDGEFGVLRVQDDGPGIPAGEHDLVFERFSRGAGARPGGSGLGLAMVRESAMAVGGIARVLPCELGTLVEIRWPRAGI